MLHYLMLNDFNVRPFDNILIAVALVLVTLFVVARFAVAVFSVSLSILNR